MTLMTDCPHTPRQLSLDGVELCSRCGIVCTDHDPWQMPLAALEAEIETMADKWTAAHRATSRSERARWPALRDEWLGLLDIFDRRVTELEIAHGELTA